MPSDDLPGLISPGSDDDRDHGHGGSMEGVPFMASSFMTPGGTNVEVHVTTATVPSAMFQAMARGAGLGGHHQAMVLQIENGILVNPTGGAGFAWYVCMYASCLMGLLWGLTCLPACLPTCLCAHRPQLADVGGDSLDHILTRILDMYQPPMQPTAAAVLSTLPRLRVPELDGPQVSTQASIASAEGTGGVASMAAGSEAALDQSRSGEGVRYAACQPGEPCTVCHDHFSAGAMVIELPCQHCYHEECITPWLQQVGGVTGVTCCESGLGPFALS